MKPIPTSVHGLVDYFVGAILLFAPYFFVFSELAANTIMFSRLLGIIIIAQALLTNYELGVFRVLSMRAHLIGDYILGAIMIIGPWIFGFADNQRATAFFVIVGLAAVGIAALTRTTPLPHPRPV